MLQVRLGLGVIFHSSYLSLSPQGWHNRKRNRRENKSKWRDHVDCRKRAFPNERERECRRERERECRREREREREREVNQFDKTQGLSRTFHNLGWIVLYWRTNVTEGIEQGSLVTQEIRNAFEVFSGRCISGFSANGWMGTRDK